MEIDDTEKLTVPQKRRVPVIGIIGGIGSGKSFLAQALADRQNFVIVKGDDAGHKVLEDQSIKARIAEAFGAGVILPSGEVNRRALGRMVFGTSLSANQARHQLEQIVHPQIRAILLDSISTAQRDPNTPAIILDAAILVEAGWQPLCDAIIYVDVSDEVRLKRVCTTRAWTEEDFHAREASQLALESKKEVADYIVDNSRSPEQAIQDFQRICSTIMDDLPNHSGSST